ncbi:uncharacterized protein LOC131941334 isoform X2 [Physella acuta]|uniref:uncharacterized protein LOC131941334 isoform X2 n=1 Tax=Physella acuta TaxID=109671 RepID=UPI0027DCC8D9|nr:uncharacterized protein LOC131941334 isoform X2 [Physella acuta]
MDFNNYENFNIHDIDYMNNNHRTENYLNLNDGNVENEDEVLFFDEACIDESHLTETCVNNAIHDVRSSPFSHRPTSVDFWPNSNISVLPSEDENESFIEYTRQDEDATNLKRVCLEAQDQRELANKSSGPHVLSNKVDQLHDSAQLVGYGIYSNDNLQIKNATENARKIEVQERNRRAAQKSREKKKKETQTNQEINQKLVKKNEGLRKSVGAWLMECAYWEKACVDLGIDIRGYVSNCSTRNVDSTLGMPEELVSFVLGDTLSSTQEIRDKLNLPDASSTREIRDNLHIPDASSTQEIRDKLNLPADASSTQEIRDKLNLPDEFSYNNSYARFSHDINIKKLQEPHVLCYENDKNVFSVHKINRNTKSETYLPTESKKRRLC